MSRKLTKLFAGALFAASLFLLPLTAAIAQSGSVGCPISSTIEKTVAGTSYTVLLSDQCKLLAFTNSGSVAVTLPNAAATFPVGFRVSMRAQGAGTVTVTPTTSTINAGSTVSAASGFGFDIWTDGVNYWTQGGGAPGGSGSFNTVTFGASSTIGGTLAGGSTAATIAATGASGNLIVGTADQSGGVYLGGGATTVGNAALQAAPGTGTIVNQVVVTPGATGTAPSVLAGGSLADAGEGAVFGTNGTGTLSFDTSGSTVQFQVLRTASAVNNLTVTGSTGTGAVTLGTSGTGGTIPIVIAPKSTGILALGGTTVANSAVQITPVASSVDFLAATGSAAGTPGSVSLYAAGTDTNVLLNLGPKGSGYLNLASSAGTPAHIVTTQTTPPALTSCGGGSPAITGSDTAGIVTMGTSATGCVITFNVAYTTAPYCIVNWIATPLASQSWATTNTAITLTQTSASTNKAVYFCSGTTGG